ncbi:hypothetical protein [Streptomyces sp. Ncost-T10-10d]|nr:hypothetical protein [Streptomyces sp. Ncost-T10-10d]
MPSFGRTVTDVAREPGIGLGATSSAPALSSSVRERLTGLLSDRPEPTE